MRRPRWAAALIALLIAGCATAPAGWTTDVPAGFRGTLPTDACGGYFIAEARLNGAGPFRLLLDSGAPITAIDPAVARTLDDPGHLDVVAFGGLAIRGRIPVQVRDVRHISHALGTDIDGIAGFPLFRALAITFDFPARQVRIERAPPAEDEPGIVRQRGTRPQIRARVGSRPIDLLVDTGFSGGLALRSLPRYPLASPPVTIGATTRIDGLYWSRAARLDADVDAGAFVLERPIARQASGRNLLGQWFMRHLAVTFAQSRGLIRFADSTGRAPGSMTSPPEKGTGLVLRPSADHLEVVAIVPDSSASDAGVRAGDRITAIDGIAVADVGCGLRTINEAERLTLRLSREGQTIDVRVTPRIMVR